MATLISGFEIAADSVKEEITHVAKTKKGRERIRNARIFIDESRVSNPTTTLQRLHKHDQAVLLRLLLWWRAAAFLPNDCGKTQPRSA
jgi:hypothetical protein